MEVDAKDGQGLIKIQPLEPHKSRKMLGTHKEPTGSNLQAWEHVRKNAIGKATKIFNSSLDAKCVFRYHHSIFLPSVLHSFAANSMPSIKPDKLTNQVTRLFIPKLGYNRSASKAIVCGPRKL